MADVDLGSVKGRVELDTSGLDKGVEEARRILEKLGANSEQTAKYLEALMKVPAEYRDAFMGALRAEASAVQNLGEEIKKTKGFFDGFADTFKKGLVFGGAFEAGRMAANALLGAARDLSKEFVALVERGSEVAKIGGSFENLSASIGQSSAAMIAAMREGSKGLVDDYNLMASANKAMMLGLPVTAKEMGTLSAAATALGRAMGQDAKKSLDDLIIGLGRGSAKILDNLGIMVKAKDAYEEYAKAHGTTVQAMSQAEKQSAFYEAALRAIEERLKALGDVTLTTAESVQQIRVAWKNWTDELGRSINTNTQVIVGLKQIAEYLGGAPGTEWIDIINKRLSNTVKWLVTIAGALEGLEKRMASPTKQEGGIVWGINKALDDFNKRVAIEEQKQNAARSKTLGKKWFPSLFREPEITGGGAGGGAKNIQAAMDALSGAKAQKEMDGIAERVKVLGVDGVANIKALAGQVMNLAEQGAKVPPVLDPVIQKAALDKITKDAQTAIVNIASIKPEGESELTRWFNDQAGAIEASFAPIGDTVKAALDAMGPSAAQVQGEFKRLYDGFILMGGTSGKTKQQIESFVSALEAVAAQGPLTAEQTRILSELQKEAGLSAFDWAQQLQTLAQVMQSLPGIAGNVFGALATGISGVSSILKGFMRDGQGFAQGFKNMLSGLMGQGGLSGFIQSLSGVAGLVSIGASVGKAIVSLFNKPEYKKIMQDVGKSWGVSISEGLAKEIEQIAKTNKISRSLAELLSVSKIMAESGKDAREFTGKISDLMNAIASGAVPAEQGMAELGRAFSMVADAATKAGTVGDRALVSILKRARELGQVTPEMKAFVGQQLDSALAGISKYVAAIKTLGEASDQSAEAQARFGEIAKTSGVVFGAMFQALVSERGIVAAVDAMKGDFDSLHQTLMDTLGPEATAAILGPFGGAFQTITDEKLRPLFEGIDGITQAMTGLANAGYLSTDQFGAMQDATAQLFDEAIAGGADMRTALLAVAPGIQAAISAAEQFGVPLDADMQRLKDLAEQNGITFRTDPQMAMLDVLVSIAEVLGAKVPESARRAAASMEDLANSVPRDLDVNVNVHRNYYDKGDKALPPGESPVPPGEPDYPGKMPSYQHGGVGDFGAGTPVMLHGKEAIIPLENAGALPGTSVNLNPTFVVDPLMSNEGRRELSQFQIQEFVRQVRNDPFMQQILRDQGLR